MVIVRLWPPAPNDSICNNLKEVLKELLETRKNALVLTILRCTEGKKLSLTFLLLSLLKDVEECKEIAHEIFIHISKNLISNPPDRNIKGFVYRSVRNYILNYLKKKEKEEKKLGSSINDGNFDDSIEHAKGSGIERQLSFEAFVKRAKEVLGEEKKWQAIEMVYIEGRSRKEVAEALGITTTALRGMISRAIQKLREEFKGQFWDYFGRN